MGTQFLIDYAMIKYQTSNILTHRKIGMIDDYESFDIGLFSDVINFDEFDYEIIHKTNHAGYYMKWHLDNAKLISHKEAHMDKTVGPSHIQISPKHTIHYYLRRPVFSLIVYESTYGKDFTGGTLEFIDHTIIKPMRGQYVFFNSNELHRVNRMLSGSRSSVLVKFYPKTSI